MYFQFEACFRAVRVAGSEGSLGPDLNWDIVFLDSIINVKKQINQELTLLKNEVRLQCPFLSV